jgi:heme A synthase
MYTTLLFFHSITRWLVLLTLVYTIYKAYTGYVNNGTFTKTDNSWRHWTATISHIQLVLGMLVYTQSPTAKFSFNAIGHNGHMREPFFFGVLHLILMLTAIVVLTIGSAMAKRKPTDREKFRTILVWFGLALFIILIAIPWPFSPLAQRPYIRTLN